MAIEPPGRTSPSAPSIFQTRNSFPPGVSDMARWPVGLKTVYPTAVGQIISVDPSSAQNCTRPVSVSIYAICFPFGSQLASLHDPTEAISFALPSPDHIVNGLQVASDSPFGDHERVGSWLLTGNCGSIYCFPSSRTMMPPFIQPIPSLLPSRFQDKASAEPEDERIGSPCRVPSRFHKTTSVWLNSSCRVEAK